jgi:pilus assembly protein CpaE
MSQPANPTKVIAFVEPGEVQQQIRTAFDSDSEFELVAQSDSLLNAAQRVYATAPDLILVDDRLVGQLELVDELATKFPDIPLLALLESDNSGQAQQYLLAGFRSFLIKPFTQASLLRSTRRIRELEARRQSAQPVSDARQPERSNSLQVLTVFSPRGGVGCSTIALNLAVALHERLDVRVLLMEGKMIFGHLGLMLNCRPQNTIADLIPHAGALDEGLVEEVVSEHASGIHVLLSSPDLSVGQGIRPNDLYGVIQAVSGSFDLVVIDAGSHLDDNAVTLMDAADRVLLVTTPDLAALHDTSRFVQLSRTLGFPPDKVLIVLNRAGISGGIKTREIEAALHQPLFGWISEGDAKVMRSLNRGVPLLFGASRSAVSRDIRGLAGQLSAMRQQVSGQRAAKGAGGPAHLKRNGKKRPAQGRQHSVALKMTGR